jgi:ATP synthase protein I
MRRKNLIGELLSMLRKIMLLDLITGLILGAVMQIVFIEYTALFLLGLSVASIGFVISGLAVRLVIETERVKNKAIISIINILKVFATCIIALSIFNNNINNIVSYILGFTSHFIALILYGIFNLKDRRE